MGDNSHASAVWALLCLIVCFASPAFSQTGVPGTIEGNADVTLSGSATYTIPIKVPPGTAGTSPKIAIVYSSQGPSGVLGAGWTIGGLSKITRGLKTIRTDGAIQGPHFDNTDALFLDGQRLIPVAAGSLPRCNGNAGFIKELDDQTCLNITGSGVQGPTGFIAHTKAGLTMQYGMSADSQVMLADGKLLLWACNRIEDSAGNYIVFSYSAPNNTGDYNIDKIAYTGNDSANLSPYAAINFMYDNNVRPQITWIAGNQIKSTSRLTTIETTTETGVVSSYAFGYQDEAFSFNRFVLTSITQSGSDGSSYSPTNFTYTKQLSPSDALWWQDATSGGYGNIDAALTVADNISNGYKFISIQLVGDTTARLHAFYSALVQGKIEQGAFTNTGSGLQQWPSPAPLPSTAIFAANGEDLRAVSVNLDGNLTSPYLFVPFLNQGAYSVHVLRFDSNSKDWKTDVTGGYPIPISVDGQHVAHILSGKIFDHSNNPNGIDILWDTSEVNQPGAAGAFQNNGSALIPMPSFVPPHPLDDSAHLIDVDCDGKAELVYFGNGRMEAYKAGVSGWQQVSPKYIPPSTISLNTPAAAIREFPGFNNCPGLLVADGVSNFQAAFATDNANGWQPDNLHKPNFFFVDPNGNDAHALVIQNKLGTEVVANWQLQNGPTIAFASTLTANAIKSTPELIPEPNALGHDSNGSPIITAFVGDLNSDGWPDVVYYSNSRYQPNDVRIYDPQSGSWPPNTDFIPTVAFARQGQADLGIRFIDLYGTGRQDVVWNQDANGAVPPGALLNTGSGWRLQWPNQPIPLPLPDLTPPVPLSSANYNLSNSVQFVDVDGDGYIDLVYGPSTGATASTVGPLDPKAGVYFNRPVASPPPAGASTPPRYWKTPDPADPESQLPIPLGDKVAGDLGVRFIDLDGDGRVDIIYSRLVRDNSGTHVVSGAYLNKGPDAPKVWVQSTSYAPQVPFVVMPGVANNASTYTAQTQVQLIDVNGDGLPDLVFNYTDPQNPATRKSGVCLNTGTGWAANLNDCTKISVPVPLDQVETDPTVSIQYVDLNGDGLTDIVVTHVGGGATCTYIGTGVDPLKETTAWAPCSSDWTVPTPAIATQPGDPGYRLADVNGDGLPDIVYNWGQGHSGIYINTGSGWWIPPANSNWAFPQPFSLPDGTDSGVRIIDVNGDGLPDVILSYNNGTKTTTGAWLNKARRMDVLAGAVDGLGVTTSICYNTILEIRAPSTPCNSSNVVTREIMAATAGEAHPLRTISLYKADDIVPYPKIRGVPTSYVVQTMSVDDGHAINGHAMPLAFSYAYGGLKFDALSRTSLGFGWRTSIDAIKKITTQTNLEQGDPSNIWTVGLTKETISCANPNSNGKCEDYDGNPLPKPLSYAHNEWATTTRLVGAYNVAVVNQKYNKTRKFDLDGSGFGSEENAFAYDNYQNVIQLTTTRSDGTSITTYNEYNDDIQPNPTPLWLGRLAKSTIKKVAEDGSSETRIACFAYKANTGLLDLEIANFGDPKQVAVEYDRDSFGNIKSKKQSAGGKPTGKCEPNQQPTLIRETSRIFESLGRFATTETNPAQLTTYTTYSSAFGLPLSILGPDLTLTTNEYDGFGRLARRTDPSGLVTTFEFHWTSFLDSNGPVPSSTLAASSTVSCTYPNSVTPSGTTPLNAKFMIQSVAHGIKNHLPPTYQVLDPRGRQVRNISIGFGSRPVFQDTYYDNYGKVDLKSRPYFYGDQPPTEQQCYDQLDRVVEVDEPSQESILRTYQGRVATIHHTFASGRTAKTTIRTNDRNNPVKVVDTEGGTTEYDYDAGDRLTKILGPMVHGKRAVITYRYDSVGHRDRTIDPDMGAWTYRYNAFGELIKQTDAEGQITSVDYDPLGRPKERIITESGGKEYRRDTWEYDTGTYGGGHLSSITSSNGYGETYFHDSSGRTYAKSVTIGTEAFYTISEFDEYSRITAVGYPNGFKATYLYDQNGYLVDVTDGKKNGTKFWTADKIDELGRVIGEHFGNGAATSHVYSHDGGYLSGIETKSHSIKIQDLTLVYNFGGDLISQTDGVSSSKETFDYDDLEQLTGVNGRTLFEYDVAGRKIKKGGDQDFTYGNGTSAHPFHAPSSFIDFHGLRRTYVYDDNGNREDGPTGSFKYTPENRVRQVLTDPLHWSDFEYGPVGSRFRQIEHRNFSTIETVYAGLFERSVNLSPELIGRYRIERDRNYLVNQSGVFAVIEVDRYDHEPFLKAAGSSAANAAMPKNLFPAPTDFQHRIFYLHKDELGSITHLTDEKGDVKASFSYDVWGVQKTSKVGSPLPDPIADSWTRGYAGHEEIASARFVHMDGRVYDPHAGIFLSPDLMTQSLTDDRTLNRYTYVLNNPLRYVDPTGYGWFSSAVNAIGNALGSAANAVGSALSSAAQAAGAWLQQNWREVVVVGVAIGVSILTAGTASPILAGMIAGATVAGGSAALYGGSIGDVLKAAITGAIFGTLGGGISEAFAAGSWESVFAQGSLRGFENAGNAGNFLQAFGVGALSALEPDVQDIAGFSGAAIVQIGAQAALNGTISAIEGNKFANGALWGAYLQAEMDSSSYQWSQSIQSSALASFVNATQTLVQDATGLITAMNAVPTALKGVVAAAAFASVTTFDASAGPFEFQTSMMLAGAMQQMQTDPFAVGSIMFSSSTLVGLNLTWQQDYPNMSASYMATYGYGFAAQGPFSSSSMWRSQTQSGSWSPW